MRYVTVLFLIASALYGQDTDHYSRLLHAHRLSMGLSVPQRQSSLDRNAEEFALELSSRGELSHRDRLQRGPEHRAAVLGLGLAGEVIGYGPQSTEVFTAWLKSPGHRKVLDSPEWQFYGVGVAPLGAGHIVVIVFWAPP